MICDFVPGMTGRWRGLALIAFAFGPIYFGLIDGQNSTVSLLLFMLMYRSLVRGNDRAAGVWAALGLFKPQLFIVFPLVFLASQRWRALASYAVTALVLGGISVATVGVDGMVGWLRILFEMEAGNAHSNAWRMHSLKAFFDLLLPGHTIASMCLYAVAALGLLGLLAYLWRRAPQVTPGLWVCTSIVAVLVDPHLVDYDLTVLVAAGVMAAIASPALRWWIVSFYPLLVFRSQLPLIEGSVQLTTVILVGCAAYGFDALIGRAAHHGSQRPTSAQRVPASAQ
jgi:hypothetical protein